MIRPVKHRATQGVMREAAERWCRLKDEHRAASEYMWAGMIASNFTPFELSLIDSYLSPRDKQLLKTVEKASVE